MKTIPNILVVISFCCLSNIQSKAQVKTPNIGECQFVPNQLSITDKLETDTSNFCLLNQWLTQDLPKQDFDKIPLQQIRTIQTMRYDSANTRTSIDYAKYGYLLSHKLDDTTHQLYFLDKLIFIYSRTGRYIEANKLIFEGESLSRASLDTFYIAQFKYRKAIFYRRALNRFETSIELLEEYKDLIHERDDPNKIGYYYHIGLATAYARNNKFQQSQIHGDSAIIFADLSGDPKLIALAYTWRSWYYPLESGEDMATRLKWVTYGLNINKEMNDREQLAANSGMYSKYLSIQGNHKKALEVLDKYKNYYEGLDDLNRYYAYYFLRSEILEKLGRKEEALEDFKKGYQYYKTAYAPVNFSELLSLQNQIEKQISEEKLQDLEYQKMELELKVSKQKNITLNYILTFALLSAFILFYVFRKNQNQKLSKLQLENELTTKMQEFERQALKAQMNPHFIFNALNSIKSYIVNSEPRKATKYLNKFAHLIRLILDNSAKKEIELSQELKALEMYIQLEQSRLNHNFDYEITVEPDINLEGILIPPLILQPYAENAIWHGLMKKEGERKLKVSITRRTPDIIINIRDNGIGRSATNKKNESELAINKTSKGSALTEKRIEMMHDFKKDASVQINDLFDSSGEPEGTEVIIKFKIQAHE